MKKTLIVICSILIFILLFVAIYVGYTKNSNSKIENNNPEIDVVKVGVIAPLTDSASAYWIDAVNTYNFSVDRFNDSHEDIQVELIIEDWKCDWTSAVNAVQKLINVDNIDVLLWGRCSAETLAAWPIAQENNLTTLAAWSSSPDIVNIWDRVYRFYNDNISANKLAKYMNWKYDTVAVIYSNDAMYVWLYESFKKKFNGNIIPLMVNTIEKDYVLIAQQLLNKIEWVNWIVLLWDDEFTVGIIKEMEKLWLLEMFQSDIFWAYQLSSNQTVQALWTGVLEGMKQISTNMETLWNTEKWKKYIEEFKQNYDVQWTDTYVYFDADGIELLLEAIENWARTSDDFKNYFDWITANSPRDGILWNYYFNEDREADWLDDAIELQEIHDWIWININ